MRGRAKTRRRAKELLTAKSRDAYSIDRANIIAVLSPYIGISPDIRLKISTLIRSIVT